MSKTIKIIMILIAIGLSFLPYSLADLDHCWNLNSDANDLIGSNHGSVNGATAQATCKVGDCYSFDGSNDYIDFGDLGAYDQWTFSFWASANYTYLDNYFQTNASGNDCGMRMEMNVVGGIRLTSSNDCSYSENVIFASGLTLSDWNHFVFAYNGTNLKVWVNGVGKVNATKPNIGTFPDFEIGTARPLGRYMQGKIDEIKFYDTAFTGVEVTADYNSGNGVACSSPSPTLTVSSSMANESNIGHDQATIKIGYNGSYSLTNGVFNCNLLDNNTVINSSSNVNVSANQYFNVSLGEVEKLYLLKINCTNADVSDDTQTYGYRVDRIIPIIKSTLINNSNYTQDDTLSWSWNCTDTNLLAMNSTLKDINGNSVFNRFNNATANSIFMSNSSSYVLTSATAFTYELTCWDSHTAKAVRPIQWYFQDGAINVEGIIINASMKELDGQGRQATYFYLDPLVSDRYKLKVTFLENSKTHSFTLSGSDLVYLPNSKYKGHFIYKMERWLDFQGNNIERVDVIGNNPYQVTVHLIQESDEIELESIGDLNKVVSIWNIDVLSEEETQTTYLSEMNANILKIKEAVGMIPLVMLYAIFMVLGYWMIQTGNSLAGWMLYVVSFGFDFLFAGYIYQEYFTATGTGFANAMYMIFVMFLFVWLIAKGLSLLFMQKRVRVRF